MANRNQRRGSAIVTVMIVITVAGTFVGTMAYASASRAVNAARLANKIKATAIAEAGVAQAYSVLVTNWGARNNSDTFPKVSYGGGSYDVTVRPVGGDMAIIISTGVYSTVSACVMADLRDYGVTTNTGGTGGTDGSVTGGGYYQSSNPYDYTVFTDGSTTLNGNGTLLGRIHANGAVTANGGVTWGNVTNLVYVSSSSEVTLNGNSTIHGALVAPKIKASGAIDEELEQAVPKVKRPNFDSIITTLYNTANANGQVRGGVTYGGSTTLVPPGGVLYVNGSVTINGTLNITGCIVATGSITINGGGGLNQTYIPGLPALISRDESITFNGSRDIKGLLYANSSITFNGSGTLQGAAIAGGSVTFNGNYGIVGYNTDYLVGFPYTGSGGSGGTGGGVAPVVAIGVSAWQK